MDVDGACLDILKNEETEHEESSPRNDGNFPSLSMILEKVAQGSLHTLCALSEPFEAKILFNDGGGLPVVVSLNFKSLRYANKSLPEKGQYQPIGGIYRLQERSKTGVPAKELWIPPAVGGLKVLVETFQGSI